MNPVFICAHRSADFVMICFQLVLLFMAVWGENWLILSGPTDLHTPMLIGFIRLIKNNLISQIRISKILCPKKNLDIIETSFRLYFYSITLTITSSQQHAKLTKSSSKACFYIILIEYSGFFSRN